MPDEARHAEAGERREGSTLDELYRAARAAEEAIQLAIEAIMEASPPLTPAQRARLVVLLEPGRTARTSRAAA